jgi:hypothetical protein
MRKYYLNNLVTFAGIVMGDYSRVKWGNSEKKELKAASLPLAITEAQNAFKNHREQYFKLLDNRFTTEQKMQLHNDFPKEIIILEEIVHSIPTV